MKKEKTSVKEFSRSEIVNIIKEIGYTLDSLIPEEDIYSDVANCLLEILENSPFFIRCKEVRYSPITRIQISQAHSCLSEKVIRGSISVLGYPHAFLFRADLSMFPSPGADTKEQIRDALSRINGMLPIFIKIGWNTPFMPLDVLCAGIVLADFQDPKNRFDDMTFDEIMTHSMGVETAVVQERKPVFA